MDELMTQLMGNLSSEIQTIVANHGQTMNQANQLFDTFDSIFEEPPAVPRTHMRAEDSCGDKTSLRTRVPPELYPGMVKARP
jgi:hypothetical protein